ncbi:hypothetical protein LSH36_31g03026 [Paralvinella palmiformis]|uniref:Annexin n=1 Tax=Paralvinella palmiformis TaxID=53620 RepID=A0AAD9NEM8_9ANNE|nr:hypothetical protein LSH36_31g03026 [Paralvinella palmiformis]
MATIHPNPDFDPEAASNRFKESMRGLGTDEEQIIQLLVDHSNDQRQEIKTQFATMFGQDMEQELKSELGGDFEEAVVALITPPRVYDAKQLKEAVKGAGTNEDTLIEILITRSNDEIEEIKAIYKEEFDSELLDDVQSDTSGYIKRLLFSQCNASRNEDSEGVDDGLAGEEAQEIYDAGEGQCGTDEAAISRVFCLRSWSQLRATFDAYAAIADKDIRDVVKSETSGSLKDAYLAIGRSLKKIGHFLHNFRIDLEDVKTAFEAEYEQSLADFVESDCGGDYKRLLLSIINHE